MHVVVEALGAGLVVYVEDGERGGSLFLTLAVVELGVTGAMIG